MKTDSVSIMGFNSAPLLLLLLFIKGIFMLGSKVSQGRLEVTSYDKNYYQNPVMTMFDYDTATETKAMNVSFTLKKDLPNVVMLHVQLNKLNNNNEYRVFPLNFTGDICSIMAKDTPETRKLKEHSNMTPCPMKKGSYHITNLVVEKRKPPPYIPIGMYMAEATTTIEKNVNLLTTRTYFKVE